MSVGGQVASVGGSWRSLTGTLIALWPKRPQSVFLDTGAFGIPRQTQQRA